MGENHNLESYTPGPWYHGWIDGNGRAILAMADNARIASVPSQRHGDLRLILAAPELLQSVQEFMEWLDRPLGTGVRIADIKARANATLARVKGS